MAAGYQLCGGLSVRIALEVTSCLSFSATSAFCQPVEYVESFYRGDRYKIVHRLRMDGGCFGTKARMAVVLFL
jgi:hypothetical protein